MNTRNIYLSLSVFSSLLLWGDSAFSDVGHGMGATASNTKNSFSGLYVSGSVGHSSLSARGKGYLQVGDVVNGPGRQFFSNAAVFDVGVGYASFLNDRWVIALEVHGMWDGHKAKSLSSAGVVDVGGISLSETLRKKLGMGFAVKGGYRMNDHLCAYAGVGIDYSAFAYQYITVDQDGGTLLQGKKYQTLWGISPLVGIRVGVNERLSFDFGYSHTFYDGLSLTQSYNGTRRFDRSLKPRHSVAHIGLVYKVN